MGIDFFKVPRRYIPENPTPTPTPENTETIFDRAVNAGAIILDMTMGVKVEYVRGDVSTPVIASAGGLNWRNITAFGEATLTQTQQDFIISRYNKDYPYPYDEPQAGDRIIYPSGWVWELLKIDGQECWRPMGKAMIRVHCKRIK